MLAHIRVSIGVNSIVFRIDITIVKDFLTTLAIICRNLIRLCTAKTSLAVTLNTSCESI